MLLQGCCCGSIISREDEIGADAGTLVTPRTRGQCCGWRGHGGNYQEQHSGAALPAPSLPRPGQCGGVWWWREHGGGGDGDQPAAAFDPRDTSLWISYSAVWPARGSVMWQEEYMIWCWLVAPFHYLTTEWKSVSNSPDVMGTSRGSRRGELTYIDCERQCILRKIPGPALPGWVIVHFLPSHGSESSSYPLSWTLLKE